MAGYGAVAGRVLTGLASAGLATYAVRGRGATGTRVASGLASALLGAHAAAGFTPMRYATKLVGNGGGEHTDEDRMAVRVQETAVINAPIEKVYEFWNEVDNFPKFMTHLRMVRRTSHRGSHWISDGPLGTTVEWTAEETKNVPHDVIAWRSTTGDVPNSGSVRFKRLGARTRVTVKLGYTPPAGAVGATVARFFGEDPKSQLKEYVAKMKAILERGESPESLT